MCYTAKFVKCGCAIAGFNCRFLLKKKGVLEIKELKNVKKSEVGQTDPLTDTATC